MIDFGRILRCMVISGIIGGAFFYFTYWNGRNLSDSRGL